MAAIITDSLRKLVANALLTEITDTTDSDQYYIGIGKADAYDDSDITATPIRTLREERIARANLQSVKKVTASDATFVIPRYNWTSGTIYSGYNDNVAGLPSNAYYVLTEANEVYICIQQGRNTAGTAVQSTVVPSYTTAGVAQTAVFETSDGYRWKLMYSLSAVNINNFLSANYMPIEYITDSPNAVGITSQASQQSSIQDAAVAGQIVGVRITAQGSGYTSAPTVTIRGNGTAAAATATVSGGKVVKIEMNNTTTALGSGYSYASVHITGGGGTGATAEPIIGPLNGIGSDARDELKATSLMLTVKPDGDEGGTFLIDDQDFRQIVLFKNLEQKDSASAGPIFTANTGKALRAVEVLSGADLNVDALMTKDSASAYIDHIDGNTVFYHQNENTGFGTFNNGAVTDDQTGSTTIVAAEDSGGTGALVDAFTGQVLYIENRAKVIRSSSQSEDIKIVLTF